MYSVLIADDEKIIRKGLCSLIDWESLGYEIIGEAANGREVLTFIEKQPPDVVMIDIRSGQGEKTMMRSMSGGNQQKVILGKWLAADSQLIIFDEPTRGIDVGAKYEIYKLINDLVESGRSVLMISSEMEELIGMSDRIIVLAEGQMTGELQKEEFDADRIMAYASAIVDQA